MRVSSRIFFVVLCTTFLSTIPRSVLPAENSAGADSRIGVPVTEDEALRQKREMRNNLVALREALAGLAESDFAAVESAVHRLGHPGPVATRPGVNVAAFADLERQFERSVDLAAEAAHTGNSRNTLRALSDTMGYCQSCHMAFRQDASGKAAPAAP